MVTDARFGPSRGSARKDTHPILPELCGGMDLSAEALRNRADAKDLAPLVEFLSNAEYWISFDLGAFEETLTHSPSPIRELGVAVALRFGEDIDGRLATRDLEQARQSLLQTMPPDLAEAVRSAFDVLDRAVRTRDGRTKLEAEGYRAYAQKKSLSVHALMARGAAIVTVDGRMPERRSPTRVELGRPIRLEAKDERGQATEAPEIESTLPATILTKASDEAGVREVIFLVPGKYRVRVPGRVEGDCLLIAG